MHLLADYSAEIIVGVISLAATGVFHAIWLVATLSARLKRAEKDIDGLGEVIQTARARGRCKKV